MFEFIEVAPPDPILGLNEAFLKDPRQEKINLGVGVFVDDAGNTPVLDCVKAAEEMIVQRERTKSYLPIGGSAAYDARVQQLLLGEEGAAQLEGRVATLQTPGGTGALRVAADFIRQRFPRATVWCSQPTWANHPQIFQAAGLGVEAYPYLDASQRGLDFDAMLDRLRQLPAGDVVLLHGCCHNPTGVDPTPEQWQAIAECLAEHQLLPLVDFAYQGFGKGLREDSVGLATLVKTLPEILVCSSFSKNFGLYRERVGALTVLAGTPTVTQAVVSQLKTCVRTNYSNPPAHGAQVVETILGDETMRRSWETELAFMRDRISHMRTSFVETMRKHAPHHDFSFLLPQLGMFSFSGLKPEQVDRLRDEHGIYMVRTGRINVAGITSKNIDPLCRAVASVL